MVHMGPLQEAYDAERAGIVRTLETAARRRHTLSRVTIFTDAQATILRMTSDEPRRHIATLCQREPAVTFELRWRPARKGVPENEKADEGKLADEPEAHGVEFLG